MASIILFIYCLFFPLRLFWIKYYISSYFIFISVWYVFKNRLKNAELTESCDKLSLENKKLAQETSDMALELKKNQEDITVSWQSYQWFCFLTFKIRGTLKWMIFEYPFSLKSWIILDMVFFGGKAAYYYLIWW